MWEEYVVKLVRGSNTKNFEVVLSGHMAVESGIVGSVECV